MSRRVRGRDTWRMHTRRWLSLTLGVVLLAALGGTARADAYTPPSPRPTASPRIVDWRTFSRRPIPPGPSLPGASGCSVFPGTNVWNQRIDERPVAANSATMIAAIGLDTGLHMDFGSYAGYGYPVPAGDKLDAANAGRLRLRRRVRPGGLPDPGEPADRRRLLFDR